MKSAGLRALGTFSIVLVVTAVARGAQAEESGGDWYGWQVMIPDVVGPLLFTAGVLDSRDKTFLIGLGSVVWMTGGPLVHLAHDEDHDALASLGLRLGLPIAGAALGLVARDQESETHWPLTGLLAGIAAASIVDWFVISRRSDEKDARQFGLTLAMPF